MLGINQPAVTIKQIEVRSSTGPSPNGWVDARSRPTACTGKTVAVVGSGPAGLAAAQQLTRAGHNVTVFERADRRAGCCATASPSSRWRSRSSTGASPR